jgi:hypothetical protein
VPEVFIQISKQLWRFLTETDETIFAYAGVITQDKVNFHTMPSRGRFSAKGQK